MGWKQKMAQYSKLSVFTENEASVVSTGQKSEVSKDEASKRKDIYGDIEF